MNKGKIKVNIFGQEYSIIPDDDEEYIKEVARAIDKEMKKNSDQAPMQPASRIAVLTCLTVMDRFMKYRNKQQKELQELTVLCDALLKKINGGKDKKN